MNPTNEHELREWLAEYATSNQGDIYYVVTPDDVYDYEIEELQAIIRTEKLKLLAVVSERGTEASGS